MFDQEVEEPTTEGQVPSTDKVMRRIQALINKADHPNTGEAEAQVYRAKAEKLMMEYRIQEEELRKVQPERLNLPIQTAWPIVPAYGHTDLVGTYWTLFVYVCSHAGVRTVYEFRPNPDEGMQSYIYGVMVGYESDVRYAQILYAGIRLTFASFLDVKPDPTLSDSENCYRLRRAGWSRANISLALWNEGNGTQGPHRVTAMYKAECKARGEDPTMTGRYNTAKSYREAFKVSFAQRIWERLSQMRSMSGVDSGALVLRDRKVAVDEEFYRLFPNLRPKKPSETAASATVHRGRPRKYQPPKPLNPSGLAAGAEAANEADLVGGRPAPVKKRLEG